MVVAARALEVTFVIVLAFFLYFFIIKPWRQGRSMTLDGMLAIGLLSIYWQDMLASSFRPAWLYNSVFLQFGSWAEHLPFWTVPNGHLYSEPLLFEGVGWVSAILPFVILANWVMRKAEARYPNIGRVGLLGVAFVTLAVVDLTLELPWLRLGLYAYPTGIPGLTLFPGHHYQFPMEELVYFCVFWTALAWLRYSKDDKGLTFAERGIDSVNVSPKKRTLMRQLAIIGTINVMIFTLYNVPWAITTMVGRSWPADLVNRSYLTNTLCGAGSDYACPSRDLPIPHGRSSYVNNNGELVKVGK
jgi:hypothetical protein